MSKISEINNGWYYNSSALSSHIEKVIDALFAVPELVLLMS
jgi:hypothetical protein